MDNFSGTPFNLAISPRRSDQLGWIKRIWAYEYTPLIIFLTGYFILNLFTAFTARYTDFIGSDMAHYFERPIQIYNGDEKNIGAWIGFAPFYPRMLAEPYAILKYFGIERFFLEYILLQNIFLSLFSGIALYLIGRKFSPRRWLGLFIVVSYLYSYPHLYFNGFVLTEPVAVPLIIISIALMLYWCNSYKIIYAALVLAMAVAIRPSNGLLGLPFALYIGFNGFSHRGKSFKQVATELLPKWIYAALFSAAFFFVILLVVAENTRVSDGRMRGLTSHSGYNFLLAQTQSHRIVSTWDGLVYVFVPPATAHHPELGVLNVDIPIYESTTFFSEGLKVIKAYPHIMWDHLRGYQALFFDNLFPAVGDYPGFKYFIEPFRYIVFYMLVLSPLVVIAFRERDLPRSLICFVAAAFFMPAASLFFFVPDHKYFFNFSYTVFLLFAFALYGVVQNFSKYRKFVLTYILLIVACTLAFWGHYFYSIKFIDEKVKITVYQSAEPLYRLDGSESLPSTGSFFVDRLEFYERESLHHAKLGSLPYRENFVLEAVTEMEVLKDGEYTFTIFVDDGYEAFINDSPLMTIPGPTSMSDSNVVRTILLNAGKHKLRIRMYQRDGTSGLAGYYKRKDTYYKAEDVKWELKGGRGTAIGLDDEFTRFNAPK